MYNWSHIDEAAMKKADPEKYRLWRMVQMLTYDMMGEKLEKEEVKAAWPKIKDEFDPLRRRLFEYWLWGKIYLLPIKMKSWNSPVPIEF